MCSTPDDARADARSASPSAAWVDGRVTAGHQSTRVKENLQLAEDSADARASWERSRCVRALERNGLFFAAALPRHVFPPLFNKYEPGMGFGAHVDQRHPASRRHTAASASAPMCQRRCFSARRTNMTAEN